jgi:hypothetical protein
VRELGGPGAMVIGLVIEALWARKYFKLSTDPVDPDSRLFFVDRDLPGLGGRRRNRAGSLLLRGTDRQVGCAMTFPTCRYRWMSARVRDRDTGPL